MQIKKCPNCGFSKIIKKGKRKGLQRYKCKSCGYNFSSKRRKISKTDTIFEDYFYHRQILSELSKKYDKSIPWIKKQLELYEVKYKKDNPRKIVLVIDVTFFGKRKDKTGVMVFKDSLSKKIIKWKFVKTENLSDYKELFCEVLESGYEIQAIVLDGKRGLIKAFNEYPIQMCIFHQQQIMTRYLTQNPRHKASIDLKEISHLLGKINEIEFLKLLNQWYKTYKLFLDEKVYDLNTKKKYFIHKRLRSAYRSLKINLPYLFTFQRFKERKIPTTTNSLDGGIFSPLKTLIRIHRGIKPEMRQKLINDFLSRKS